MKYLILLCMGAALIGCGSSGGGSSDNSEPINASSSTLMTPSSASASSDSTIVSSLPMSSVSVESSVMSSVSSSSSVVVSSSSQSPIASSSSSMPSTAPFVAYIGEGTSNDRAELYAVRADGQDHITLSPELSTGNDVEDFAWASTGEHIVFLGDVETNGQRELYTVKPDGSGFDKLNRDMAFSGDVEQYAISPDGLKVAYRANQDNISEMELYVIDIDGGNRFRANLDLTAGGAVTDFGWSPDSQALYYRADGETNDVEELYVVTLSNKKTQKVNPPLGELKIEHVQWADDSQSLVYFFYQQSLVNNALYRYSLASETSKKLSGDDEDVLDFRLPDNGTHLAYSYDQYQVVVNGAMTTRQQVGSGLRLIDVGVGDAIPLTLPEISEPNTLALKTDVTLTFLPHKQQYVLIQERGTVGQLTVKGFDDAALFSVPFPTSGTNQGDFEFDSGILSPNENFMLLTRDFTSETIDLTTGDMFTLASQSRATTRLWSPDNTRIYIGESLDPFTLSPQGTAKASLSDFGFFNVAHGETRWVGDQVIMREVSPILGQEKIYAWDGLGASLTQVSQEFEAAFTTQLLNYKVTSDEAYIVFYVGDGQLNFGEALYGVKLDGTGQVRLNAPLADQGEIFEYQVQP